MCFTYRRLLYASPSPRHVSYSILFYRALLWYFSIPNGLSRSISASMPSLSLPPLSLFLPIYLSLWCYVPLRKVPFLPYPGFSHFRHPEMYRIVWESPEAPRDYLGKRICRSPPGPISPKCASSKRTSSTTGPGSIDARPRQVHLLDRPIQTSLAGHGEGSCRLCFLRIMAAIVPCRAAPDGLSESPLLIWPRDPEMCSGNSPLLPPVWSGYHV